MTKSFLLLLSLLLAIALLTTTAFGETFNPKVTATSTILAQRLDVVYIKYELTGLSHSQLGYACKFMFAAKTHATHNAVVFTIQPDWTSGRTNDTAVLKQATTYQHVLPITKASTRTEFETETLILTGGFNEIIKNPLYYDMIKPVRHFIVTVPINMVFDNSMGFPFTINLEWMLPDSQSHIITLSGNTANSAPEFAPSPQPIINSEVRSDDNDEKSVGNNNEQQQLQLQASFPYKSEGFVNPLESQYDRWNTAYYKTRVYTNQYDVLFTLSSISSARTKYFVQINPGYFSAFGPTTAYTPKCWAIERYTDCHDSTDSHGRTTTKCETLTRPDPDWIVSLSYTQEQVNIDISQSPLSWHWGSKDFECNLEFVTTDPVIIDWRNDVNDVYKFSTQNIAPFNATLPDPKSEDGKYYNSIVHTKWSYWNGKASIGFPSRRSYLVYDLHTDVSPKATNLIAFYQVDDTYITRKEHNAGLIGGIIAGIFFGIIVTMIICAVVGAQCCRDDLHGVTGWAWMFVCCFICMGCFRRRRGYDRQCENTTTTHVTISTGGSPGTGGYQTYNNTHHHHHHHSSPHPSPHSPHYVAPSVQPYHQPSPGPYGQPSPAPYQQPAPSPYGVPPQPTSPYHR